MPPLIPDSPIDTRLPEPSTEERVASARLATLIAGEIAAAGGTVDFARFMELALYAPDLGYYMTTAPKFGTTGDFITAPELSPLFGDCLANFCRTVLEEVDDGVIVEAGAGSGALCLSLLTALERRGPLPLRYLIHERSPSLRQIQSQRIVDRLPQLAGRIVWIDEIPPDVHGIVLANELLDAIPCPRFIIGDGTAHSLGVGLDDRGDFAWKMVDAPVGGAERLAGHDLPNGYTSELPAPAEIWIRETATRLAAGALLIVDYGFPRHEYYHPDRSGGTLMCHYRHRAHGNPLVLTGLQDITVHLDFTGLAEAADDAGLRVAGYTNQAAFLLDCGLAQHLEAITDERLRRRRVQEAKILTLPSEMGELFKVLALTRALKRTPPGFGLLDARVRL